MNSLTMGRREWMSLSAATAAAALASSCGEQQSRAGRAKARPQERPKRDHPNIIVFLSDTLRADHLSCYGYMPQTSPVIDELARDGILFERYMASSTWTRPSIGTMLTGVPGRVHRAVASKGSGLSLDQLDAFQVQILREEFLSLAGALKPLGYTSAYLVNNANVRPEFGFGAGFDYTDYRPHYPVDVQVSMAFDWIRSEPREPFFLFIHQIDPHGPYSPPDDTFFSLHGVTKEEALANVPEHEVEHLQRYLESYGVELYHDAVVDISSESNRYLKMLYDAEIFMVDRSLRRLVNFLKRVDMFDNTIIAFTSDHGEGFREHGFFGHGRGFGAGWDVPYRELIHVPMIFAGGGLPKGIRVPHSTSMIDFYSTVLELAGGTPPEYVAGAPMLSKAGEVLVNEDRLVYVDLDYKQADLANWDAGVFDGRYKVSSRRRKNGYTIFDTKSDPGEFKNLAGGGQLPGDLERSLIAMLDGQIERYEKLRKQFGEPVWMQASDGVQEELHALGYL